MDQIVQVAGSLAILAGFALAQWSLLSPKSLSYLSLNSAGSLVLAVVACLEQQWGFLLLEAVWAAVSIAGLARVGSDGRRPASSADGPG